MKDRVLLGLVVSCALLASSICYAKCGFNFKIISPFAKTLAATRPQIEPPVHHKEVCNKVVTFPDYAEINLAYEKGNDLDGTKCAVTLRAPEGKRVHVVSVGFNLENDSNEKIDYPGVLDKFSTVEVESESNGPTAVVAADVKATNQGNFRRVLSKGQELRVVVNYNETKEFHRQKFMIVYEFFDAQRYAKDLPPV